MYPTDIKEEEKAAIMETEAYKSWRSKYSFFDFLNAIRYLIRTGVTWTELPKDFPKGSSLYHHYRGLIDRGYWDELFEIAIRKPRILTNHITFSNMSIKGVKELIAKRLQFRKYYSQRKARKEIEDNLALLYY